MATKNRKRFSKAQYKAWGETGGSPILLSYKLHRPVKGYKVTRTGKGR